MFVLDFCLGCGLALCLCAGGVVTFTLCVKWLALDFAFV